MSNNLAYMNSPGTLPKILDKIIKASVPESFNSDFLGTKLGFSGGNQKTFISWAKKSGFINTDGTPTQIYKNFRNPASRGVAMAKAIRIGYEELYTRNEYVHELAKKDLVKLISEVTGKAHDHATVKVIAGSFWNAKEFANFEAKQEEIVQQEDERVKTPEVETNTTHRSELASPILNKIGLNYTINLVLPKTDDPAIYDAIFKSLKSNLLNE